MTLVYLCHPCKEGTNVWKNRNPAERNTEVRLESNGGELKMFVIFCRRGGCFPRDALYRGRKRALNFPRTSEKRKQHLLRGLCYSANEHQVSEFPEKGRDERGFE